jgi:hypothetical protein
MRRRMDEHRSRPTTTRFPLVVCGHAGTAGAELLRRRDLAVWWTLDADEAIDVARHVGAALIVSRPEHSARVRARAPELPVVSLRVANAAELSPPAPPTAEPREDDTAGILHAISRVSGARFATHARVRAQLPVHIELASLVVHGLTIDLSETGLAVSLSLPLGVGDRVRLTLGAPLEGLVARAEVVRTFGGPSGPRAGLKFVDLAPADTRRIADWVAARVAETDEAIVGFEPRPMPTPSPSIGDAELGALRDHLGGLVRASHEDFHLGGHTRARAPAPARAASASNALDVAAAPEPDAPNPGRARPEPSRRADTSSARALATTGATLDPAALAERAHVRAELLRQLHVEAPSTRAGTVGAAPAPRTRAITFHGALRALTVA